MLACVLEDALRFSRRLPHLLSSAAVLQIVIKSEQMPTGLRNIAADHVNKLLKVQQ